jgi:NitT/TauT family transport system permease protein
MALASSDERPPDRLRMLVTGAARLFGRSWLFLVSVVAFFLAWELAILVFDIKPYILPRPTDIVTRGWADIGKLLYYTWVTGLESVLGYLVAVAVALPLGLAIAFSTFLRQTIYPFFVSLEMTPKIAFAPLFISWLGFGIASKVALAAFIATFPVVVGTAAGLHAADENARMLFRTMGASRLQTLIKLKIPTGLPHIFTGLKIAAIGVVAGAITAEFLGGGTGMGHQIRTAASQLDTPRVFALILYLSILGLATFWSVVWLQQRLVFWHKASSRQSPVA